MEVENKAESPAADQDDDYVEISILRLVQTIDNYSDEYVEEIVRVITEDMKNSDPRMRSTKIENKDLKIVADFLIEYVSRVRPHLCQTVISEDRREQLKKRRCTDCHKNLPCFICGVETPINIIHDTLDDRKKRVYFSCKKR